MRALFFTALLCAGCPSPDEAFTLKGRVVDELRQPQGNLEVRVLRDRNLDGVRCLPMLPFTTLTTDASGRFSTTLYRQQLTLGAALPRFFRVEVSSPAKSEVLSAYTFRFPAVDVALPDLPVSSTGDVPYVPQLETFSEGLLDGVVAWCGGLNSFTAEDRQMAAREVTRTFRGDGIDSDVVGGFEVLGLELRVERPMPGFAASSTSVVRGAACDVVPVGASCPLTDGRMASATLAPGTVTVSLTWDELRAVSVSSLRAVRVEGAVAAITLEGTTPMTPGVWQPWYSAPKFVIDEVGKAATHCSEPGAFILLNPPINLVSGLRLRFEDARGTSLPILSMAEVTAR
jgi:hypothetical protein